LKGLSAGAEAVVIERHATSYTRHKQSENNRTLGITRGEEAKDIEELARLFEMS
jgi:hypothetical protein